MTCVVHNGVVFCQMTPLGAMAVLIGLFGAGVLTAHVARHVYIILFGWIEHGGSDDRR